MFAVAFSGRFSSSQVIAEICVNHFEMLRIQENSGMKTELLSQ